MAQRPAAIVSPEPGTTRDIVEVLLDIAGFPCIVGDTAGLRDGGDVGLVEKEGVLRAKKRAEASDLRFLVIDATMPIDKALDEVRPFLSTTDDLATTVLVLNKIDLILDDDESLVHLYSSASGIPTQNIFPISCLTKQGLTEFGERMAKILEKMTGSAENVLATNERQRRLLSECISYLQAFLGITSLSVADIDDPARDIVMGAEELRYAANSLGKISGKVDPEEVLGTQ